MTLRLTEKMQQQSENTVIKNEHSYSVDNFEIVGTAVKNFHLKLKESFLILKMKSCLNIAQELIP